MLPCFISVYDARQFRTRTHQAHLAQQHIDKLWQFVEAGLADDASNTGHARIVANFVDNIAVFVQLADLRRQSFRVRHHRAELEHLEQLAAFAHTLLHEKHGAFGVVNFNRNRHHHHNR
jgi:hypothetical protein